MFKILRITRHATQSAQLADLQRIYGSDVEVVQVAETVADAAAVKGLVETHAPDVLEAVLPHGCLILACSLCYC